MSLTYAICAIHYGSSALTEACLRSTLELDPAPRGRLVVDNTGRDGEPLALPDSLAEQITLVTPEQNLGFGGGANLGFEVIARDLGVDAVLLLNNDAQLLPGAVGRLLRTLESEPTVAMVGPRILRRDDHRIWHDGGRIHWPEGTIESIRHGEPEPEQALAPYPTDFVCGCAPLVRRAAFESVGGFDERFFLYYEDADLSLRLSDRGWRLWHQPNARIEHVGSGSTGEGSDLARYYQVRNRCLFHHLHAPPTADTNRARGPSLRRIRGRALRCLATGRFATGRALWCAARDYRRSRWGRWNRG